MQEFKTALLQVNEVLPTPHQGTEPEIIKGVLNHLQKIKQDQENRKHKHTVQHYITELLFKSRSVNIYNSLNNTERLWLNKAKKELCSRIWLDLIPKMPAFTLSNEEFRYALLYKFLIPIRQITLGNKCNCNRKSSVDVFGHHFVAGCPKDNARGERHNLIANTVKTMCQYCKINTTREELHCFITANQPNSKKRPDLSIHEAVTTSAYNKELVDVSVTTAVTGVFEGPVRPVTDAQTTNVLQAVEKGANSKNNKYKATANQNNYEFIPFILDINGCLNKEGKKLIAKLAERGASIKGIPVKTIRDYFLKLLSAALQRSNGHMIYKKLLQSKSKALPHVVTANIGDDDLIRYHQVHR